MVYYFCTFCMVNLNVIFKNDNIQHQLLFIDDICEDFCSRCSVSTVFFCLMATDYEE